METLFDLITVNKSEYEYFKNQKDSDKVVFLLQLFDQAYMTSNGIDLSGFFSSLTKIPDDIDDHTICEYDSNTVNDSIIYESKDYINDPDRVDVLIDDDNIVIESNSLKAVKHITYKFAESGYILRRDYDMEKMFKKDKITKYLRIFYVIDQISSICTN